MRRVTLLAVVALVGMVMPAVGVDARVPRCAGLRATIVGTNRADILLGMARRDVIVGLGGGDTIRGRGGDDIVCGGNGNDRILGGASSRFAEVAGNEVLYGQGGDDELLGGGGFDALVGGPGDDLIDGGRGAYDDAGYWPSAGAVAVDLAAGTATGEGSDVLRKVEWAEGSSFDDTLQGTGSSNRLFGGPGDDVIDGRGGIDEVAYISPLAL